MACTAERTGERSYGSNRDATQLRVRFHTVCYGGPPEYTDFPKEGQWALSNLDDKRDLLMMSEGVRWANELVMEGELLGYMYVYI